MYQGDASARRGDAAHNPFSGVVPGSEPRLTTASGDTERPSPDEPAGRARAMQYDVALNGWELGGGSVRIHRRDLLERSFALMGHTLEGMREKFGALRSEEHTSELQSRQYLVCRLLLEKKKKTQHY